MFVKGKMSRSSLGQVMPVHADPLGFTNASFRAVSQVTFSYRTNTDSAAALLPRSNRFLRVARDSPIRSATDRPTVTNSISDPVSLIGT
jgi:hypothetical protein